MSLLELHGLNKHFGGLHVTNAVNLAFLMVNLSWLLVQPFPQRQPDFSILDLKAQYRAPRSLQPAA